jgi:hypothetical protein
MLWGFSKLNRITKSLDENEQTMASTYQSTNSAYNFPTTLLPCFTKKKDTATNVHGAFSMSDNKFYSGCVLVR